MSSFLVILASYFIGSIPFSHIFPWLLKGHDVREKGTKNVGASNALVVAGKRAGLMALIGDIGKGIAVILLARYFGLPAWAIALTGLAAVVGHDFSIFLGFKGGKGVATAGGVLMALDPIFGTLTLLLWIFTMIVLRYFIPSTVLVLCFVPVFMWLGSWPKEYILYFGVLNAMLAVYAHRANLQLFFAGQELTISESLAKHFKK
ncbi:MAG: glycerol-3-phosphate 1-O-acyltransferase PlsY [Candidatus Margulisbacteria bacterium]|nr:glycerol-3-phosphate 1-O-acyltransferase PlsY [Candidatus Margulisiibacteriota bacterium]